MTPKTKNEEQAPPSIPSAPTPAREWRQDQGDLYRLPGCGHVVRLRRPSLAAMAAKVGQIPNQLTENILQFLVSKTGEKPTEQEKIEQYQKYNRAYIDLARIAFIEPRLVVEREPDYDAGEISPDDIADNDYIWLWTHLINGDAEEVNPFRLYPRVAEN